MRKSQLTYRVDRAPGVSVITSAISSRSNVTHEWNIINTFAGTFTEDDMKFLKSHPHIKSIEEGGCTRAQAVVLQ